MSPMSLLAPFLLACGGRKLRGGMGDMGGVFLAYNNHYVFNIFW